MALGEPGELELEGGKNVFPLRNASPVFRSEYYDAHAADLKTIFAPLSTSRSRWTAGAPRSGWRIGSSWPDRARSRPHG